MILSSSKLGIDGCVEMIMSCVEEMADDENE